MNFFDKKKKKERDGGGFLWLLGDGETRWRRGPPLGGSPAVVSFQSIHPSIFLSPFLFFFFYSSGCAWDSGACRAGGGKKQESTNGRLLTVVAQVIYESR